MPRLNEKKSIIIDFLVKCNTYSEQMLRQYEQHLTSKSKTEHAAIEQKIHDWKSYRKFNDYAINELKGTELDHWFNKD